VKRTIGIEVDIPIEWDEEDFEYLMELLENVVARNIPSSSYEIQEYK